MKTKQEQKVALKESASMLIVDIEKHEALLHKLASENVNKEDVEYFNKVLLGLALLKDIANIKQTLSL